LQNHPPRWPDCDPSDASVVEVHAQPAFWWELQSSKPSSRNANLTTASKSPLLNRSDERLALISFMKTKGTILDLITSQKKLMVNISCKQNFSFKRSFDLKRTEFLLIKKLRSFHSFRKIQL
jgi:hypothetical protein